MGRRLILTLLVALAVPSPAAAQAGLTSVRAHDIPLRSTRSLATVVPEEGFELVGVHWQGAGSVEVRVRRDGRAWGPWLEVDADAAPDARTAEGRSSAGWRLGEGLWVGQAARLEVRTRGVVRRVRAWTVRSRVSRVPTRTLAVADSPPIVTRAGWRADESIRRDDPDLAPALRNAIVHHTAGSNTYTREQAPALVRAIMAYHVQANGWDDIGYNALVDRFGTVYEGRFGGLDANVVGAHAKGFNAGAFGIAVLGEFTTVAPPKAAIDALVRTLAWRLDLAHVDPLATLDVVSAGNERFQPGVPVFLRAIGGHRDTGLTACPGTRLYAQLPALAARVAALGLPKLYAPSLSGVWGGPLTLTARLSTAGPWTVSVEGRDDGVSVLDESGTGREIAVVWDTTGLLPGAYVWRIEAPGATPATGTLDTVATGLSLAFSGVAVDPEVIAPDGDGTLDATTVTYTISADANVSAVAVDAFGLEVGTVEAPRWRRAGEHAIAFGGLGLPDGAYEIRLVARGRGGQEATHAVRVAISRTLGQVALGSPRLTPNGDGRDDRLGVRFTLATPAAVRLRVFRLGKWVATPFTGTLDAGPQLVEWDGRKRAGALREGDYTAVLEATDLIATARVELPFLADWTPPRVRLVSAAPPRLRVSEPATLAVVVNGLRRRIVAAAAGPLALPGVARIRTLVVVARDRAGNVSELRLP